MREGRENLPNLPLPLKLRLPLLQLLLPVSLLHLVHEIADIDILIHIRGEARRILGQPHICHVAQTAVDRQDEVLLLNWQQGRRNCQNLAAEEPDSRQTATRNVTRLTRHLATIPVAEILVVVRIVDVASDDVARVPGEGRVARLLRTEHLVTAVNLVDAHAALGTRLRLAANQGGRRLRLLGTRVLSISVITLHRKTLVTSILGTDAALVGCGEITAAPLARTALDELANLGRPSVICRATLQNIVPLCNLAIQRLLVKANTHETSLILAIYPAVGIKLLNRLLALLLIRGSANLHTESVALAKNLHALQVMLAHRDHDLIQLGACSPQPLRRLYEDLHGRQHRLLAVHQRLGAMLSERAIAERLRQVEVDELAIPPPLTPHTVGVLVSCEQVSLHTASARVGRTVRACHLETELLCVGLETDEAGHFWITIFYRPRTSIFTKATQ